MHLRVLQVHHLYEDHLEKSAIEELEAAVIVCGGEAVVAAALEQLNALPYLVSSKSPIS